MRRVGADPEQLFERQPLQVIDRQGFRLSLPKLPAPFNLAWGLLSSPGVSWREKIRTAWWMERIKRQGFRLPRDISVAAWLDEAGQTGTLRRHLWEPLCLAALNTPVTQASAQLFANVLRDSLGSSRRQDTDLLLPRVDFGQLLPEPAGRWLQARNADVRLGCRVRQLAADTDRIVIDGERFAAAILATAPQHVASLWPACATDYAFEPIATIYLQFSATTALPFPLLNLLGRHGQWVVDRGNGLLACVVSGHGDWEALPDDELATTLAGELDLGEAAAWHKVIREKRATFSARPGIRRPACRTSHPRIFLAGDYTWDDYPATLEGAVRSGRRAARQAMEIAPAA